MDKQTDLKAVMNDGLQKSVPMFVYYYFKLYILICKQDYEVAFW